MRHILAIAAGLAVSGCVALPEGAGSAGTWPAPSPDPAPRQEAHQDPHQAPHRDPYDAYPRVVSAGDVLYCSITNAIVDFRPGWHPAVPLGFRIARGEAFEVEIRRDGRRDTQEFWVEYRHDGDRLRICRFTNYECQKFFGTANEFLAGKRFRIDNDEVMRGDLYCQSVLRGNGFDRYDDHRQRLPRGPHTPDFWPGQPDGSGDSKRDLPSTHDNTQDGRRPVY